MSGVPLRLATAIQLLVLSTMSFTRITYAWILILYPRRADILIKSRNGSSWHREALILMAIELHKFPYLAEDTLLRAYLGSVKEFWTQYWISVAPKLSFEKILFFCSKSAYVNLLRFYQKCRSTSVMMPQLSLFALVMIYGPFRVLNTFQLSRSCVLILRSFLRVQDLHDRVLWIL